MSKRKQRVVNQVQSLKSNYRVHILLDSRKESRNRFISISRKPVFSLTLHRLSTNPRVNTFNNDVFPHAPSPLIPKNRQRHSPSDRSCLSRLLILTRAPASAERSFLAHKNSFLKDRVSTYSKVGGDFRQRRLGERGGKVRAVN